jgi:hypothetical protein
VGEEAASVAVALFTDYPVGSGNIARIRNPRRVARGSIGRTGFTIEAERRETAAKSKNRPFFPHSLTDNDAKSTKISGSIDNRH